MARTRRSDTTPDSHAFPTRRYDLVKEFVIALAVMTVLSLLAAAVFSSPDDHAITMKDWATAAPNDVTATAVGELAGTTTTAGYGSPYNTASDGQTLGPLHLQKWAGVTIPVDAAKDLVLDPVRTMTGDSAVVSALTSWDTAGADQQTTWATTYGDALAKAPDGDPAKVATGDYGPVPALAAGELTLARSGALEGLLTTKENFFGGDSTKALLLLSDGTYLESLARAQNLGGDQWGIVNETGNYPGQPWLWLYSVWYQISPFNTSANADIQIWALMIVLSVGFALSPWIPGVRDIPRVLRIHRLIWRHSAAPAHRSGR
ncbi:MAG: hypothetical protein ABI131_01240 [Nostocoides sp.]